MAGPLNRLDMPLDYRSLWMMLRIRLQDLQLNQAINAATNSDMEKVRKSQGGYALINSVLAIMEDLVSEARSGPKENEPPSQN